MLHKTFKQRGVSFNPANRFEKTIVEQDWQDLEHEWDELLAVTAAKTEFVMDQSKSILTKNNSPGIAFTYSVNAYRGCEHGCIYCYARPTHETLGLGAGIDFETKIHVKQNAPELLRKELSKSKWEKDVIAMSGVTDCYQPAERRFRLTRQCLEVMLEYENPTCIITKNSLVLRDLDLLTKLAEKGLVSVSISLTSLDPDIIKVMEPRTALPQMRLKTIETLSSRGIPVGIIMAPVIPGLTDQEIPQLLKSAADAGAQSAHYVLLRLPHAVKDMFVDWLDTHFPERSARVQTLLKDMRGGEKLYDSDYASRMTGQGPMADQIGKMFNMFAKKYGLKPREV